MTDQLAPADLIRKHFVTKVKGDKEELRKEIAPDVRWWAPASAAAKGIVENPMVGAERAINHLTVEMYEEEGREWTITHLLSQGDLVAVLARLQARAGTSARSSRGRQGRRAASPARTDAAPGLDLTGQVGTERSKPVWFVDHAESGRRSISTFHSLSRTMSPSWLRAFRQSVASPSELSAAALTSVYTSSPYSVSPIRVGFVHEQLTVLNPRTEVPIRA